MMDKKIKWLTFTAVSVGLLILISVLYGYVHLKKDNENSIANASQHVSVVIQNDLEVRVQGPIEALQRMGYRWEKAGGLTYTLWENDAKAYLNNMPIFYALQILDKKKNIQWSIPKDTGNSAITTSFKYPKPEETKFFQQKKDGLFVGQIFDINAEEKGFFVYESLYYSGQVNGYLVAELKVKQLFHNIETLALTKGYGIRLTAHGEVMYRFGEALSSATEAYVNKRPLQLYNALWELEVWPSQKVLGSLKSPLPNGILLGGLLFLILVEILFFLVSKQLQLLDKTIKAKEETATEAKKNQLILENANEGFITTNKDGVVIYWNPFAEKIFGWTKKEMIGKSLRKHIFPDDYKKVYEKSIAAFFKSGETKAFNRVVEIKGLRKDGSEIPIEITLFPTKLKSEYSFHAFVRDISERKAVDKMKNEFISVVSHELRTPLTAIKGSLSILSEHCDPPMSEKSASLLGIAVNNCNRLIRLINDILDIEKIEAGKVELHRTQFKTKLLAEEAIKANESYAKKFNVSLKLDVVDDVHLDADFDRMIQVLTNLISNAVKYSPPEGTVTLKLQQHHKYIRLSIKDEGEGIPKEFQSSIFGRFSQGDASSTRKKGGTGLGLNISQAILQMHDGKISFESKPKKGTIFHVDMPYVKAIDKIVEPEQISADVAHNPHILVCEDDVDCANLIRMMLEKHHFRVDLAHTAKEAKALLNKHRFDAITLDMMLPDESGVKIVKHIQQHKKNGSIPIIVISAYIDQIKGELNGSATHIAGWLNKPIDQRELEKIVTKVKSKFSGSKAKILHVEDDEDVVHLIKIALEDFGRITPALTLQGAKDLLKKQQFDLVILDLALPDGNGADLLPIVNHKKNELIPVVVFSSYDIDSEAAQYVQAHLMKSKTPTETLVNTVKKSVENKHSH